jgi:hypothetical protein
MRDSFKKKFFICQNFKIQNEKDSYLKYREINL